MEVQVPAKKLAVGMFVSRLDRPWLETPFLLQGFLVEDDEMLAQVCQHCEVATVDVSLSVAGLFPAPAPSAERTRLLTAEPQVIFIEQDSIDAKAAEDHLSLLSAVRDLFRRRDKRDKKKAAPEFGDSSIVAYRDLRSFPEELPEARVVHSITTDAVTSFLEHLRQETLPDMEQVGEAVRLVVDSMVRNPSAMLWLSSLKAEGGYIYSHAVDASIHMIAFGRQLGFPKSDLIALGTAGMCLDIGKMKLSKALLNFPGVLTQEQRHIFQQHVAQGVDMVRSSEDFSREVVEIVARHHERYDGSGYPVGMKGEEIGLFGSMAGIVDTFTALTCERPHATAKTASEALRVLNQLRGTLFQSALIDQFVQCIGIYPIGSLVELSTGDVAIVVEINRTRRLKPKVMLVLGPDKQPLHKPVDLDLVTNPTFVGDEIVTIRRELPPGEFGLSLADYFL